MNNRDVLSLSARALVQAFKKQRLSPVDAAQACLRQVEKLDPVLNAFCHVDAKQTLRQAKESEKRWKAGKPLSAIDGVPTSIKDWFHVTGWPTRQGSKNSSTTPQKNDSLQVAKLRASGAVFIGKTTLPEFGHKGVTHSPLHGITRNPWDTDKTCGGSSGGAAVAAATGMAWLNLGSDAGGSVRIPASFTGVFGFKPSPGVLPSWPPSVFSSLSAVGPLARSVEDAALLLDALSGYDPRDFNQLPKDTPLPRFSDALKKKQGKLRILNVTKINGITLDSACKPVYDAGVKKLQTLGDIDSIALQIPKLAETFAGHWTAVASLMTNGYTKAMRKNADPRFLHWAERGDQQHLHAYLMAEYDRMVIGGIFREIFEAYDLIISPATPFAAFDVGIDYPHDKNGKPVLDWNIFNAFANLAKLPACVLPAALNKNGLPVGVQICANYLQDEMLMRAALAVEKSLGFSAWLAHAQA